MDSLCDETCYRILIIDDNRALHDDFRKILTPERRDTGLSELEADLFGGNPEAIRETHTGVTFELDSAFQGKDGFEMVQAAINEGRPYALAFVDMRMPPGWDGLETIEHLWRAVPDLQIVICTAYSDHSWSQISSRLGSTDQLLVLKKPFDRIEIVQAAHALVKKWCLSRNAQQQREEWDEQIRERTEALEEANRKLADEKLMLENMQTRLRLSQKLEAVGQLATGVAHEINTPIQYVGHNLAFLKISFHDISSLLLQCRDLLDWPEFMRQRNKATLYNKLDQTAELDKLIAETRAAFEQAQEGVRRVTEIAMAIREFAYPGQPQKVMADINKMIANTLSVASYEYKGLADIKTEFGDIPPVPCSIADINQVFLNLIVNAAHAIGETLERGGNAKGLITITTSVDEKAVIVTISDTGCGIADDIKDKIFDPLFTTKEAGRGTGQGLSIVRAVVVDGHGGEIDFETEVNRGTTFIIRLPRQVESVDDEYWADTRDRVV
jgi:signal transduction histidine kinase